MTDPKGFLTTPRVTPTRRPVPIRLLDWQEVYEPFEPTQVRAQAGRCMDCGIPFCHNGCPLGNLIPEWNDLVHRNDWRTAAERLHATNNFPEFTGRLCPAPCEAACVVGISGDPVAIKQVEVEIAERAWNEDWVLPQPAPRASERTVAVVGSGPAGLAVAQQLTRAGHTVVIYERSDRVGGLLRYGIPEFKMEKSVLDRRLEQMTVEGTRFRTGVDVGVDVTMEVLRQRFDVVVLAVGATAWRDLPIPGRDLWGIHQAMEFLPWANRVQQGDIGAGQEPITAAGKHVVIIGGGDTGADCLGTSHRQGALSVAQLEIMPIPPQTRHESTPWPTWPLMMRTSSAHEEGGERLFSAATQRFIGQDGHVAGMELVEVRSEGGRFVPVEGTERIIPADLVLLAMGFTGPAAGGLVEQAGASLDAQANLARDGSYQALNELGKPVDGVFICGDAGRGQSLIVWAIAEGRAAAAAVDSWLTENPSQLPAPVLPSTRQLMV